MEESARRTPGWLMRGGLLEPWGPPTGATSLSDTIVRLVGERVPLSRARIIDLCAGRPERWLLVGLLAETRASAVYVALDRELGRPVAIKVHRDTDEAKVRARTEGHIAAIARGPHVIAVHDFATWQGLTYTVFELCDADLEDWHVGRPWREILARIIEAGRGLARVHQAGFIHGDVKPSNILILAGTAKICDFGISISAKAKSWFRGGTPGYLPESALRSGPTTEDDVYSLAFTAWECLFGELPFGEPPDGTSSEDAFVFHNERSFERAFVAPTLAPDMPAALVWLLKTAMKHEPSERPTLSAFLRALEQVRDAPVGLQRALTPKHSLAAVMAASLLFAGVGFACARHGPTREEPRIVEIAMASQPPLVRAEMAAKIGDGATAVSILIETSERAKAGRLSKLERRRFNESAARIISDLKRKGATVHAETAHWLVVGLETFDGPVHIGNPVTTPP